MENDVKLESTTHMDALEFLGSTYIRPQQVVLGPIETLRAQHAATWREVLIHRVSTSEEPAEEANLLKLLASALVRSPEVKRLVLDFGEDQGFMHVITENEPQCELLSKWLQSEIDNPEHGGERLSAEEAVAMGEFARLFANGKMSSRPLPRLIATPHSPVAQLTKAPVSPETPIAQTETGLSFVPPQEPSGAKAAPPEIPVEYPPAPESLTEKPVAPAGQSTTASVQSNHKTVPVTETAPPIEGSKVADQSAAAEASPVAGKPLSTPPSKVVPLPGPVSLPVQPLVGEPSATLPNASAAPPASPAARVIAPEPEQPSSRYRLDEPDYTFTDTLPKPVGINKLRILFIILGVLALFLILATVYLSSKT